ncbi:MAG: hypothetical protein WBO00_06470 [Steroidobacteraceae bacterium]
MNSKHVSIGLMAGATLFGATLIAYAGEQPAAKAAAPTDQQLIESAVSAAPAAIGRAAAVVTMTAEGTMRTLRKGTNPFTCMPDAPQTPGPDPMCWDKNSDAWMQAFMHHGTPPAGKVGLMYMLAGGTDASNTDPYAAKPTAKNHWIKTGPHIMIVGADAAFYDQYPKSADPDTSAPYVMWAGTPLQHLMAPVK